MSKIVSNEDRLLTLSKKLSRALRHQAVNMGLNIEKDGYVSVSELLRHRDFRGYKVEDIKWVIANNDKKRFEVSEIQGMEKIRAVQGHSIETIVDEELLDLINNPSEVPYCIHGTYRKYMDSIMESGLKRMQRNHMHFAPGE